MGLALPPESPALAYAAISYHKFADKNQQELITYAEILGHRILDTTEAAQTQGPDLATAAAYSDFRVDEDAAAKMSSKKVGRFFWGGGRRQIWCRSS